MISIDIISDTVSDIGDKLPSDRSLVDSGISIIDHIKDKIVLDYCAGNGDDGIYVANNGAEHVHGIDISDVSIKNCKQLAIKNNVQNNTTYNIGDAENTDFDKTSKSR